MFKKSLALTIALIMMFSLVCIPVYAAPTLKLDKTEYTCNEKITVTVSGGTEEGTVAIHKPGTRADQSENWEYVSSLIAGKWETEAPYEAGTYEMRLYAKYGEDDSLLAFVSFTVGGAPVEVPTVMPPEIPTEVTSGHNGVSDWAIGEINDAIDNNLVTGRVMADFQRAVTREEFCELAIQLYEAMSGKKAEPAPDNTFSDTKNPQILKAFNLKIVNGVGDGKFAPNNPVTRQEIAVMLLRTVQAAFPGIDISVANPSKFVDDADIADWAKAGVNYFFSIGIIKGAGGGVFAPLANTTCEAAIALVTRTFNYFSTI